MEDGLENNHFKLFWNCMSWRCTAFTPTDESGSELIPLVFVIQAFLYLFYSQKKHLKRTYFSVCDVNTQDRLLATFKNLFLFK